MRHKQWEEVLDCIRQIARNVNGAIIDKRSGKRWDHGQAICAEAYGTNWSKDPTFIEWNNKDNNEPPEPHFYEVAKKMAAGYVPEWMEANNE